MVESLTTCVQKCWHWKIRLEHTHTHTFSNRHSLRSLSSKQTLIPEICKQSATGETDQTFHSGATREKHTTRNKPNSEILCGVTTTDPVVASDPSPFFSEKSFVFRNRRPSRKTKLSCQFRRRACAPCDAKVNKNSTLQLCPRCHTHSCAQTQPNYFHAFLSAQRAKTVYNKHLHLKRPAILTLGHHVVVLFYITKVTLHTKAR